MSLTEPTLDGSTVVNRMSSTSFMALLYMIAQPSSALAALLYVLAQPSSTLAALLYVLAIVKTKCPFCKFNSMNICPENTWLSIGV